jgi:hypothetical protein
MINGIDMNTELNEAKNLIRKVCNSSFTNGMNEYRDISSNKLTRDDKAQTDAEAELLEYIQTLINAVKGEWISVEDRLPEFGTPVFCWESFSGRWVGSYEQIENTAYGNWWNHFSNEKGYLPATHWMALPLPPTEKQDAIHV